MSGIPKYIKLLIQNVSELHIFHKLYFKHLASHFLSLYYAVKHKKYFCFLGLQYIRLVACPFYRVCTDFGTDNFRDFFQNNNFFFQTQGFQN